MKAWAVLHVLFVLGVQFAPTLHAAVPHHDEPESSCSHSFSYAHVEAEEEAPPASPCFFCGHAPGTIDPTLPTGFRLESPVSLHAIAQPGTFLPAAPLFLPTASRGPPAGR